MHFTSATVSAFVLSATGVASFSQKPSAAFVVTRSSTAATTVSSSSRRAVHPAGCMCPSCTRPALHPVGCACGACRNTALHPAGCACGACRNTALFLSDTTAETEAPAVDEDVPAEVEALDGIESNDEAHNAERPARKSLKKKGPRGKPLDEFSVGETVTGKVKSVASYGAFLDIGAQTDGLLHISQLSVDFVSDVKSVLDAGQEVEVRILSIDEKKGQVALSLLSEEQEQEAKDAAAKSRPQQKRDRPARRDDSAVLAQLVEKGWDPEKFIEGTVVSTVDFGAFVRVDASQLNSEVAGELDGLVHISALTKGRANTVTSIVNVNDKVKVRVKSIADRKVSLSMVSVEDEKEAAANRGGGGGGGYVDMGNREWRKAVEEIDTTQPKFENRPLVVDNRK